MWYWLNKVQFWPLRKRCPLLYRTGPAPVYTFCKCTWACRQSPSMPGWSFRPTKSPSCSDKHNSMVVIQFFHLSSFAIYFYFQNLYRCCFYVIMLITFFLVFVHCLLLFLLHFLPKWMPLAKPPLSVPFSGPSLHPSVYIPRAPNSKHPPHILS